MPLTNAEVPLYARRIMFELFSHLKSMDVSLTRLIELNQAPRANLDAAGSGPFGGTVGITPGSCTVLPPSGYGPGVLLPANPHRRGLIIQNLSAAAGPTITIGLGSTSPQSGQGLTILPQTTWNGKVSELTWNGLVSIVASGAGAIFCGVEVLGRNETRRRGGLNQPI